ncbi:nitroreductase [Marinomonas sp. M1K-6]|uniref:Putative NAD(P)H nitroreductase n=3 Tax=Marinomonas profundi TaxID=2726122 RepID=A0A847R7X0_9GAMM|nr:nitroreductase [Marinomonas profundi]NLQ16370.1 nitroreductase [Marinomonas profundi]UDV04915.1 nitroreductase [Marinomonas profundi]
MNNDFITFMRNRISQPALSAPAPTSTEWEAILSAASRAADHGNLKPWRFRIYEGEGRARLGQIYWHHALSEVDSLPASKEEAFIKKAYRAPAVLLVYAHLQKHPKVPDIEQVMAASAAAQQVLLGLNALGYGAMWRSGPACFTQKTKDLLSLEASDQIIGLIYTGTPKEKSTFIPEVVLEPYLKWVRD